MRDAKVFVQEIIKKIFDKSSADIKFRFIPRILFPMSLTQVFTCTLFTRIFYTILKPAGIRNQIGISFTICFSKTNTICGQNAKKIFSSPDVINLALVNKNYKIVVSLSLMRKV